MAKKNREIHMSTHRFLEHVKSGYEANQRYCFILGSGASCKSGISTGEELIKEWKTYLREKELQCPGYIKECADDCQLEEKDWKRFLDPDYQPKNEDYFSYYDLRFAGMPVQAYHYLQKLMEKASPSFGFYLLAAMLENTENKLVITTNFDSLVEDTLFLYHAKHPLVVGHESLASFIEHQENTGRPIVAKVHRDLYLRPLNRKQELKVLDDRWKDPLQSVLTRYIPIVIGYAGGDQTLMNLLEKLNLRAVYWCSLKNPESERIETFLRKQPNRYLVEIKGFDEIMFALFGCLMGDADFDEPEKRMREYVEQRCEDYKKQYRDISKSILDIRTEAAVSAAARDGFSEAAERTFADGWDKSAPLQILKKFSEDKPTDDMEKAAQLRLDAALAMEQFQFDSALKLLASALKYCKKAIQIQPENNEAHVLSGDIYTDTASAYQSIGDYNRALDYYKKALEIRKARLGEEHPDTAKTYNNIALVYRDMGNSEKALEYNVKAIRIRESSLGKDNVDTATSYNNIALVYRDISDKMKMLGKQKESEENLNKSLDYYKKAIQIREEALGRDHIETAFSYNNIACNYRIMGDYDKALEYHEKALQIRKSQLGDDHPETALSYHNIANVYRDMGREKGCDMDDLNQAQQLYEKALAIRKKKLGDNHPATATTYDMMGTLFHLKEDEESATKSFLKAFHIRLMKLGPKHLRTQNTLENLRNEYIIQHPDNADDFLTWLRRQLNAEENRALDELLEA